MSRWIDAALAVLVGLPLFILGASTASRSVGIGDFAEFQYQIATMGVPHPTGYPLYLFLAKPFTWLPIESVAYRVNLFSAFCGAVAVGVAFIVGRQLGAGRLAAATGALLFAGAPLAWYWSIFAKPYTLHVATIGIIVALAIAWSQGRVSWTWVMLLLGIGFGNHRGLVLIVPALALFWLVVRWPTIRSVRFTPWPWLAFGLPWLMYLYIPLRGIPGRNGFWDTLIYGASGSALIFQIQEMSRDPLVSAADFFGTMTPTQLGLFTIPAAIGLLLLALGLTRGDRRAGILLIGGYVAIVVFHLRVYGGDITGFMLPTFWILAVGFGLLIDTLTRLAPARLVPVAGAVALLGVVAIGPIRNVQANFPTLDQRGQRVHELRANELLDSLDPNGVLVLNDDWLAIWQIRYQRDVAGYRPDTSVVQGGANEILRGMTGKGRPAYAMNFVPELAAENRLLPVLALWKALDRPIDYRYRQRVDATFANSIRLTGWAAPDTTIIPGDVLPIILNWEALDDIGDDLVVFVHLIDADGKSPAGWDAQPFGAELPTSTWKAGQRIEDPHGMLLPKTLPAGRYSVAVGLYPEGSRDRLAVVQNGTRGDAVRIGPFRVAAPPAEAAPRQAVGARFGEVATLVGIDREPIAAGALPLALTWRADRPTAEDYTVTIQLIDGNGRLAAQRDSQPVDGRYPTGIWASGETILDRQSVPLANVGPGSYRLIVALYGADGRRLAVSGGDSVDLGMVTLP